MTVYLNRVTGNIYTAMVHQQAELCPEIISNLSTKEIQNIHLKWLETVTGIWHNFDLLMEAPATRLNVNGRFWKPRAWKSYCIWLLLLLLLLLGCKAYLLEMWKTSFLCITFLILNLKIRDCLMRMILKDNEVGESEKIDDIKI